MKSIILLLLIGIISSLWLFLSKGSFFILLLVFVIFLIVKNFIPQRDRNFIFNIIIIGFILRVVLIYLYYYFYLGIGYTDILGPDGEVYSQRGWYISRILLDQNPDIIPNSHDYIFINYYDLVRYLQYKLPPVNTYQTGVFAYLIGILYSFFDYSWFLMKLMNAMFSILTGVIVYFIGREIFNSKIGKISTILFIFLPSVCMFSITGIKEPLIIFLLTTIIWLTIKFQKSRGWLWLMFILCEIIFLMFLRLQLGYTLMIVIPIILFFFWKVNIFKKVSIIILIFISFLLSPLYGKVTGRLQVDNFFSVHIGYVNTPGKNYKIFPDRYYSGSKLVGVGFAEVIWAFVKGIFHLFFEPLPYKIDSKNLLAYAQTILFSLLMPFVLVGLGMGLRYRFNQMIPLVVYLVFFIPLIAISEGNIGTVFRHRDMLTPFLIIPGIAGLYAKLLKGRLLH